MAERAQVSVIIPTYNRPGLLSKTLQALRVQTYPRDCTEIIVVDDGSTEAATDVIDDFRDLNINYVTQPNRGATAARNWGAQQARGGVFVFMDDDIESSPQVIDALLKANARNGRSVITGTLTVIDDNAIDLAGSETPSSSLEDCQPVSFTHCFTGLLCIGRSEFFELDMFQDPTGGWPNWDDVDFGYRAHLAGYRILGSRAARAVHHDLSAVTLDTTLKRWYEASRSVVRLLQKYPGFERHLPMLYDKLPIHWDEDSWYLVVRKILRWLTASKPSIWILKQLVGTLTYLKIAPQLALAVKKWLIGSYQYRGFQRGLADFGGLVK